MDEIGQPGINDEPIQLQETSRNIIMPRFVDDPAQVIQIFSNIDERIKRNIFEVMGQDSNDFSQQEFDRMLSEQLHIPDAPELPEIRNSLALIPRRDLQLVERIICLRSHLPQPQNVESIQGVAITDSRSIGIFTSIIERNGHPGGVQELFNIVIAHEVAHLKLYQIENDPMFILQKNNLTRDVRNWLCDDFVRNGKEYYMVKRKYSKIPGVSAEENPNIRWEDAFAELYALCVADKSKFDNYFNQCVREAKENGKNTNIDLIVKVAIEDIVKEARR